MVFIHAQAVQELVQHKKATLKFFLQYSYLKTVKLAILSQFAAVMLSSVEHPAMHRKVAPSYTVKPI